MTFASAASIFPTKLVKDALSGRRSRRQPRSSDLSIKRLSPDSKQLPVRLKPSSPSDSLNGHRSTLPDHDTNSIVDEIFSTKTVTCRSNDSSLVNSSPPMQTA